MKLYSEQIASKKGIYLQQKGHLLATKRAFTCNKKGIYLQQKGHLLATKRAFTCNKKGIYLQQKGHLLATSVMVLSKGHWVKPILEIIAIGYPQSWHRYPRLSFHSWPNKRRPPTYHLPVYNASSSISVRTT